TQGEQQNVAAANRVDSHPASRCSSCPCPCPCPCPILVGSGHGHGQGHGHEIVKAIDFVIRPSCPACASCVDLRDCPENFKTAGFTADSILGSESAGMGRGFAVACGPPPAPSGTARRMPIRTRPAGSGSMLGDANMAKWWMGVALAVVVVGQQNAALAQYSPAGPGLPAEPVPCAPSSLGGLLPGPLPGHLAPPGPGPDLSISGNSPGAFSCDDGCRHADCYFYIGTIAFMRQSMGKQPVAILDPGFGTDTGIRPTANRDLNNTAFSFGDVPNHYEWGVSATVGYAVDYWAIEASGYYI